MNDMRTILENAFKNKRTLKICIYALILTIGLLDYRTGGALNFNIFYLIPVSLAIWNGRKLLGFFTAALCTSAALLSDLLNKSFYENPTIQLFNAALDTAFFVFVVFMLSYLRKTLEKEKRSARIDYLTGALNPQAFIEIGNAEIARSKRYKHNLSLAYIDCDNFKYINDTYDHRTGDALLKAVVRIIKEEVRNTDIVTRLGGDEFAILLPESGYDEAYAVAHRVMVSLFMGMKKRNWPVTFSVGVVVFNKMPSSFEEVIHKGDQVMYSVKKNGKNSIKLETIG